MPRRNCKLQIQITFILFTPVVPQKGLTFKSIMFKEKHLLEIFVREMFIKNRIQNYFQGINYTQAKEFKEILVDELVNTFLSK